MGKKQKISNVTETQLAAAISSYFSIEPEVVLNKFHANFQDSLNSPEGDNLDPTGSFSYREKLENRHDKWISIFDKIMDGLLKYMTISGSTCLEKDCEQKAAYKCMSCTFAYCYEHSVAHHKAMKHVLKNSFGNFLNNSESHTKTIIKVCVDGWWTDEYEGIENLLENGFICSTPVIPKCCFSFKLMKMLHILHTRCQLSHEKLVDYMESFFESKPPVFVFENLVEVLNIYSTARHFLRHGRYSLAEAKAKGSGKTECPSCCSDPINVKSLILVIYLRFKLNDINIL
jgi:hypothetical protein